ncbi:hypothetical protein CH92_14805 [Stutzerimonas stutzeri]|uniref:Lipoprotein n=1 Tax=Stutzerimonas stutzeri TaxID=316 RepID=W8R075_STUST|nr:hypothetical protein [Stutzerimonas stutzeri]AHL76290.1 hypothetical protein CH92_14805 [Stutzerimonas stutzeri]MCQ4329520.1 hypothetical protein [Stutzerimonas stutzeri]
MKALIAFLAIAATLTLQGCMTYSHNTLPEVEQWPLAEPAQAKPTAYIKVQTEYSVNGTPTANNPNIAKLESLIKQSFTDSGRFSRVSTEQQTSDLYVTVTLRNQETGNLGLAVITGATFFLVPGTFDNTLIMDMMFRDGNGKKLGRVEKQEKLTTWMHLFLVFALPFNESADGLLTELTKSNLEEAASKDLI